MIPKEENITLFVSSNKKRCLYTLFLSLIFIFSSLVSCSTVSPSENASLQLNKKENFEQDTNKVFKIKNSREKEDFFNKKYKNKLLTDKTLYSKIFSNENHSNENSKNIQNDLLIGSFYYPGWESNSPNWNIYKDLTTFPEREPLTGWKNIDTKEYMKKEIKWASQYGLDYFSFDWYWNFDTRSEGVSNNPSINVSYALDNFRAVNKEQMKYCLMWANHYDLPSDMEGYKNLVTFWQKKYFGEDNYLKTEDGRPIIYIFSFVPLQLALGTEGLKYFLRYLKEKTNAYVICINDIVDYGWQPSAIKEFGFDAISGWNYLWWVKESGKYTLSYSEYKNIVLQVWEMIKQNNNDIPIFPTVSPGWDTSPWEEKSMFNISDSNPVDFQKLLFGARDLLKYKKYGEPNLMMIQSWNEFGEGSFIVPTKKWKFEYLKAVESVKESSNKGKRIPNIKESDKE